MNVDKSEKFQWLVRLGYAARGLVYVLIGYIALRAEGGRSDPEGGFALLRDVPLGVPLLYLSALGLFGYALYRFASFALDVENHGNDGKGIAHRVGYAASAVAHIVLAYTAFQYAQGQSGSGGGAEEAAGSLLSFTFGSLVLGLIGVGFLAGAVVQAKSAWTRSFMRNISSDAPAAIEHLGRAGLTARAVVFLIIGWSLVQSAWLDSSSQVKTLGEAISSLGKDGTIYTLVAIGLLAFGIFGLMLARYRIVPDIDKSVLKPSLH